MGLSPVSRGRAARVEARGKASNPLELRDGASRFFAWLVDQEYLDVNPLAKLKGLNKKAKEKTRAPTADEIRRTLEVAPEKRRLMYEVGFCTGFRKKELASLEVRHLDRDLCGIQYDSEFTKNRQLGFQPLPRSLVDRLAASAEGKQPTDSLLTCRVTPRVTSTRT